MPDANKPMRFLVAGSFCEYTADLCIETESEELAIEAWKKAFADKSVSGMHINVWHLDGKKAKELGRMQYEIVGINNKREG